MASSRSHLLVACDKETNQLGKTRMLSVTPFKLYFLVRTWTGAGQKIFY